MVAPGNKSSAKYLLSRLDRIGIKNGAVEAAAFPTRLAGESRQKYRLNPNFDWENGVIAIGSKSWADFTGDEGFIAEVVRATGIPE